MIQVRLTFEYTRRARLAVRFFKMLADEGIGFDAEEAARLVIGLCRIRVLS